ncbi:lytic transglycosylase domain-containing protein [Pedomonas mirosovicensis]|uniref:lytic transglycosylase domain-containing protein n=1 Tax=Pedomonas mirosovicensis TaxID=2908641 RepID=UPI0021677957|nr:lytic transglycosylase domain-containing protein [Pedomonas mirosovicensis]MCH8685906.1 lytic transglycosylase domain-containing protein [Pedomonas mirosovicensis]
MLHAVARQESLFNPNAVSPAGARGLMQLMPGTAKEVATRLGVPYAPQRLYDEDYNLQLGASYLQRMITYFDGNHVLAVAAYNAGPGNVNKWLRRFGDPRQPGVDVIDWIEQIPFSETRNYVQRVLENAVVYALLKTDGSQSLVASRQDGGQEAQARETGQTRLLSRHLGLTGEGGKTSALGG